MFKRKIAKRAVSGSAKNGDLASPVIDFDSQKKEELVENIFKQKPEAEEVEIKAKPMAQEPSLSPQISKTERAALPVLVVLTVIVGVFFIFTLHLSRALAEAEGQTSSLLESATRSFAVAVKLIGGDTRLLFSSTCNAYSSGANFLGSRIYNMAALAASATVSFLK
jgi:hypothetical protein